jgi:hypothetical protein
MLSTPTPSSQVQHALLSSSPQAHIYIYHDTIMTMPSIRDSELEEDEWDPQGLNAMSFDVVEGDDKEEDEEDIKEEEEGVEEVIALEEIEDEEKEGVEATDLDVDGLTELEQMEQSLLREESLDFAMISEEE